MNIKNRVCLTLLGVLAAVAALAVLNVGLRKNNPNNPQQSTTDPRDEFLAERIHSMSEIKSETQSSAASTVPPAIPLRDRTNRSPFKKPSVEGVELKREDEPEEAAEFYRLKRAPAGEEAIPVERYLGARDKIQNMVRYSTSSNQVFAPDSKSDGLANVALGTWTPLGPGNIGGRTRSILIDSGNSNVMYAGGVAGGVWKTTNGGSSWTALNDFMANLAISTLAMDPTNSSVIYAGTGEGFFNVDAVRGLGIFKTTNGGTTWTQLANTNNSNFHFVNKIIISPVNSLRVYAGTSTGVWRSLDGGSNWTQVHNPGTNGGCMSLAIRNDQVNDYVLASFGNLVQATIYRNTDAGGSGTWTSVLSDSGQGRTSLAIAPSNQATVYALSAENASGTYQHGLHKVFRSVDGGATWTTRVANTSATKLNTVLLTNPVYAFLSDCGFGTTNQFFNQGWYDNVIAVDPADANRVWVGGIDLFRSDDGGANWGIASHWWAGTTTAQYAHADNHAIVFHPAYNGTTNQIMFVGSDGGLFKTSNARAAVGTTASAVCNQTTSVVWSNLNNGYAVTQFYDGVPYPNNTTYIGGTQDNGTNRGTDAGGANAWNNIMGGDGGYVAVDPSNTSNLFAEFTRLSIQKSTNGGASFNAATTGITESSNNFLFINPFIMDPGSSQRLWTGGFWMWRTTNQASSWTQASAITCGGGSVSAIAVAPSNANNVLSGMSDGCINRTSIGLTSTSSTNWSVSTPRSGYVSWVAFDPANASVVYATYSSFNSLGSDKHVYKSINGGANWSGIDGSGLNALPDIPVHTIVVDPANSSRLYIGTDLGVFTTIDGGANWMQEVTGFANVIVESLKINTISGVSTLFAFTHGRGAWRTSISGNTTTLRIDTVTLKAGRTSGGQMIRLTGAFAGLSTVTMGGVSAAWFYTNGGSDTSTITVTTPAHAAGAVQIDLTPTSGSGYSKANAFAYLQTVFTDNTIFATVTVARAQHVIELRQAIDAMRAVAGLASAPWTDPTLSPASTFIKAVHIQELRTYLNDAASRLGYSTSSYTDPSLTGGFMIKRVHIEELRQRIRTIAG